MATQLTVQQQRQSETQVLRQTLDKMAGQIKMALPAHISVEKFQRVAITAVQTNPDLLTCDRSSLFASLMKCAQDGLLPDGRDAAIAIFKGQAQYMPMVAGLMKKARQSGEISSWSAHAVHANDDFEYVLGDDERIIHKPTMGDQGPVIAAYSIVKLRDGTVARDVMTRVDIEKRRAVSRQGNSLQWTTFYEEGAVKTVIKHHAKRLPSSTDVDKLIDALDRDDMLRVEESAAAVMVGDRREPSERPVSRLDALEQQIGANDGTLANENPTASEGMDDNDRGERTDADDVADMYRNAQKPADIEAADMVVNKLALHDDLTVANARSDAVNALGGEQ
jgi:recombination protein RecT